MKKCDYPDWLRTAVFYEIYPQSFQDNNGDGIGDLAGVISRLDHIQALGCNAIWLNPCFESPFGDAGYDVSDFCKVAARYGTNADLEELFEHAHARGIRVCLDLVAGHTSIEHPWFVASASAIPNEFSDRYIWTDSAWRSVSAGLSQINGYSARDGNYATNFFHFQPALNYGFAHPDPEQPWQLPVDHPACRANRDAMKDIMRFWLDRGADGFRVDMASSLVKGDHDFSATMKLWQEMRDMYDREYPDAVLIAEWSDPERAIAAGFHIDFLIHFNHPGYTTLFRSEPERDLFRFFKVLPPSYFDKEGKGDVSVFINYYTAQLKATAGSGFISLPTGNHDIMRLAHGRSKEELKVAYTFLLTMPGVPYIYAGDEIGQRYVSGLPSKEGGYNRTGSRTPMQWDGSAGAGFSSAPQSDFYLPLDPAPDRPDVAAQDADPDSLLNFVRSLLRLRCEYPVLGNCADFSALYAEPSAYPLVYSRTDGGTVAIIAVNPSGTPQHCKITLPFEGCALSSLLPTDVELKVAERTASISMPAVSFAIWVTVAPSAF